MKYILLGLAMLFVSNVAMADELIMVYSPDCSYCQAFIKEAKKDYENSDFGRAFPLTMLNVKDPNVKQEFAWLGEAYYDQRWKGFKVYAGGTSIPTPQFHLWKGDRATGHMLGETLGYKPGGGADWVIEQLKPLVK